MFLSSRAATFFSVATWPTLEQEGQRGEKRRQVGLYCPSPRQDVGEVRVNGRRYKVWQVYRGSTTEEE